MLELQGPNLQGAKLCGADLHKAILIDADMRGADLRGAFLVEANLRRADLRGARHLSEANFAGAKLNGAKVWARDVENLKRAGADLSGVEVVEESDEG
jgi:uncharacterized protein YjbI with pentapeptide repeats